MSELKETGNVQNVEEMDTSAAPKVCEEAATTPKEMKTTETDVTANKKLQDLAKSSMIHKIVSNTLDLNMEDLKQKIGLAVRILKIATNNSIVTDILLNGRLPPNNLAPLHMEKIHTAMMKLLLRTGADPKVVTAEGLNFVQCAIQNRSPRQFHDVVKLVVENNLKDLLLAKIGESKMNLLQFSQAFLLLTEDTVKLLESLGLHLNDKDELGFNTLFHAVMRGRGKEWLEQLVKLGADWKAVDIYEASILHVAATYRNVEAVKYFAGLGLDVDAKDKQGRTPFHCVTATDFDLKDRDETILALIELGADFMDADLSDTEVF